MSIEATNILQRIHNLGDRVEVSIFKFKYSDWSVNLEYADKGLKIKVEAESKTSFADALCVAWHRFEVAVGHGQGVKALLPALEAPKSDDGDC